MKKTYNQRDRYRFKLPQRAVGTGRGDPRQSGFFVTGTPPHERAALGSDAPVPLCLGLVVIKSSALLHFKDIEAYFLKCPVPRSSLKKANIQQGGC